MDLLIYLLPSRNLHGTIHDIHNVADAITFDVAVAVCADNDGDGIQIT